MPQQQMPMMPIMGGMSGIGAMGAMGAGMKPAQQSVNYPTLYVGELEEQINEEILYSYFSQYGPIIMVRVMRDATQKFSRGFGYVSFVNQHEAEKARLASNHAVIIQNQIRVVWKKNFNEIPKEANIFIKQLDPSVDIVKLDAAFSKFGLIFSSKIAQNEAGKKLGYGYVQFETKEAADKAVEAAKEIYIDGKQVVIEKF